MHTEDCVRPLAVAKGGVFAQAGQKYTVGAQKCFQKDRAENILVIVGVC